MTGPAIGVDIGGTKILAGLIAADGSVQAEVRRRSPASDGAAVVTTIGEAVAELRSYPGVGPDVAMGVAAAAFIDADRSVVRYAPNLAWVDLPLAEELMRATGLRVVLENDANAAAWGEYAFGAGRKASNLLMVTVGTGIGGGIVAGGELFRGANGLGAEVGHLRVVPDGRSCGCGASGCWEQYASGTALVLEARTLARSDHAAASLVSAAGGDPAFIDGPLLTRAAQEGDEFARVRLEVLGTWLGEGLASLTAVLDPDLVLVGGGVCEAGELLLDPTRRALQAHLPAAGHRSAPRVERALLGNDAGMVGAADLARKALA